MATDPPVDPRAAAPRPPFRRWFQFSLGSLMMLMFLSAVGTRLWLNRAETRQRECHAELTWDIETGENILWVSKLGSQTYATPRVAGGKVFIGTNNGGGWLKRYPKEFDLGVLLCFDAASGEFLWQHSNEKLPAGRVVDWQLQGLPSTPYVEGNRLWYVTNRCEVVCLDTEGFRDGEDDGPSQTPQGIKQQEWAPLRVNIPATWTDSWRYGNNELPPPFSKAFDDAGIDLRKTKTKGSEFYKLAVSSANSDHRWILKRWEYLDPPGRFEVIPLFEIRRAAGKKLEVYALPNPQADPEESEEPLFSVANQVPLAMLSREVGRELKEWGVTVPAQFEIPAVVPGKPWSFSAMRDDVERKYRIRTNGAYLSVDKLISQDKQEADVLWRFSMMNELDIFPHNMTHCSIVCDGDLLFINTCNGVDESHVNMPSPQAPNFLAMNKHTGKVVWSDNSVGGNVLHGAWASPMYAVLGGVPQVLFPGGDGWLYSFAPGGDGQGNGKLLWKFDCNPKRTEWILGGRGTRNNLIASAVIHDGLVYIAVGQDPEHGDGEGHLWCIDPTRRGDVSPDLVFSSDDPTTPIPPRTTLQAAWPSDTVRPNPNSAAVWHYGKFDYNGNGTIEFEEEFHRTISRPAIQGEFLVISDFSGLVHCLDAKTGKRYWMYDMLASVWGSPIIVGDYIVVGDEDGDVVVFRLSADPKVAMPRPTVTNTYNTREPVWEIFMGSSVYPTPLWQDGVLYVTTKSHLYAIRRGANYKKAKK